jgi:hypothetical protein
MFRVTLLCETKPVKTPGAVLLVFHPGREREIEREERDWRNLDFDAPRNCAYHFPWVQRVLEQK